MKKAYILLTTVLFLTGFLQAQVVTGNLNLLKNTQIKLEGFNGLKNYSISTTKTDSAGNFKLS